MALLKQQLLCDLNYLTEYLARLLHTASANLPCQWQGPGSLEDGHGNGTKIHPPS